MIEVESTLNSRPITPVTMDPEASMPLTPYHSLLMREVSNIAPRIFHRADNYASKRWRQVQYLALQFWIGGVENSCCKTVENFSVAAGLPF